MMFYNNVQKSRKILLNSVIDQCRDDIERAYRSARVMLNDREVN